MLKEKITSREWEEVKALARLEWIGPWREDEGRKRAAVGIMSTHARLDDYDCNRLLPNPPPKQEMTLEEEAEAFDAYSRAHNARWQQNQSAP